MQAQADLEASNPHWNFCITLASLRVPPTRQEKGEEVNTGFCKSLNGLVHVVSTSNPEYTICGDTFDCGAIGEAEDASWEFCHPAPITCPKCCAQVKAIREMKCRLQPSNLCQ